MCAPNCGAAAFSGLMRIMFVGFPAVREVGMLCDSEPLSMQRPHRALDCAAGGFDMKVNDAPEHTSRGTAAEPA